MIQQLLYVCLCPPTSCDIADSVEVLADSRCTAVLPGFGPVGVQPQWPPVRTSVWSLVWQKKDHQEDHLVRQPVWDHRYVCQYFEVQQNIHWSTTTLSPLRVEGIARITLLKCNVMNVMDRTCPGPGPDRSQPFLVGTRSNSITNRGF